MTRPLSSKKGLLDLSQLIWGRRKLYQQIKGDLHQALWNGELSTTPASSTCYWYYADILYDNWVLLYLMDKNWNNGPRLMIWSPKILEQITMYDASIKQLHLIIVQTYFWKFNLIGLRRIRLSALASLTMTNVTKALPPIWTQLFRPSCSGYKAAIFLCYIKCQSLSSLLRTRLFVTIWYSTATHQAHLYW